MVNTVLSLFAFLQLTLNVNKFFYQMHTHIHIATAQNITPVLPHHRYVDAVDGTVYARIEEAYINQSHWC